MESKEKYKSAFQGIKCDVSIPDKLHIVFLPFNQKYKFTMTQFTFSQVASLWKADKRQYVKPSSYAAYLQHLNKHILPHFGDCERITEEEIQGFANRQLAHGLALKTVKDSILILKMIHRYGERMGVWPHLDFRIHYPTSAQEPKALPVLSVSQQQRLIRYLKDHFSFRNLGLLICLHSGLRIGEICGLQWKDLDVTAGVIHVRKTVSRIWICDENERSYILSIGSPKTSASVRDIPITKSLTEIIRPLRKVVNPEFYVISNEAEPLEPRYYREYYSKVLDKLGIPPVRFHALRHSFATRCIESKCDYKTVSAILGHASISTTLDLYVHPDYTEKKKCIDRMARALNGA